MVAYLLFFGGMSCFIIAGMAHAPVIGITGILLAIIALGCGTGARAPESQFVFRTHISAPDAQSRACANAQPTALRRGKHITRHPYHARRNYARNRS